MHTKYFFITGTDTGVGKTYVTRCLLRALRQAGKQTAVLKPIASGVDAFDGINEDVKQLANEVTVACTTDEINPVRFKMPIAPSIAATFAAQSLTVDQVWQASLPVLRKPADVILIEGVGGFCVPLNSTQTTADLAKKFGFPLILVVGLRLGCLNHALLTYQAMLATQLPIMGWIGNQIDPHMVCVNENIETLKTHLNMAFLGVVPFQSTDVMSILRQALA